MSRISELHVKRVYDAAASSDGCRVLVDRLWPRNISKDAAQLGAWIKDVAPSTELRQWFGHRPSRWVAFKRKYFHELDQQPAAIAELRQMGSGRVLTLLFAAKDSAHNNAVALKEYLDVQLEARR